MKLIRYEPRFQEAMLALHRSAIKGFDLGMSQQQDEADLLDVQNVYLKRGGEFLLGFVGPRLMAMGGFNRLNASDGAVYQLCSVGHWAPDAVRFSLLRSVENHPSPVENIAMAMSFFGTAVLQWFIILLLGLAAISALARVGRRSINTRKMIRRKAKHESFQADDGARCRT